MTIRHVTLVSALLLFIFIALFAGAAGAQSIDTGYRPWVNGYSFQNSGDAEAFYGVDLNALAGTSFHDEIFRHTGHCYGMSLASVQDFEANLTSVDMPEASVMPRIDHIQTEQSFYYMSEYVQSFFGKKQLDNRAEYEKIIGRLSSGRPAVLGVYHSGGGYPGHAVVAYKADDDGNQTLISVYDPNLPPAMYDYEAYPATAVYDHAGGTFRYDNGQTFDLVRLNDIDRTGVDSGRAIAASLASLPGVALFILVMRRFPPGL